MVVVYFFTIASLPSPVCLSVCSCVFVCFCVGGLLLGQRQRQHQARKEVWGGPGWTVDGGGSCGGKTPRGSPNGGGADGSALAAASDEVSGGGGGFSRARVHGGRSIGTAVAFCVRASSDDSKCREMLRCESITELHAAP